MRRVEGTEKGDDIIEWRGGGSEVEGERDER